MQMFNGLNMGNFNPYKLNLDVESENNGNDNISDNYDEKLGNFINQINEITKDLTDTNNENDNKAEEKGKDLIRTLSQSMNESVKSYFENHKDVLINFKIVIEESIKKLTEKNGKFPDRYMPLRDLLNNVEALAKSLGLMQVAENKGPEIKLQLEGNLGKIDMDAREEKFYSNLDKESGKLKETTENISSQLENINGLLNNEKLKDNKDLKNLKDLLENIKTVIEHNSEGNVRALQEYTAENLSAGAKNIFDELSLKSNGEYDGKFGKGTLAGLDELLKKTGIYITEIEKALEAGSAETDQSAPIEETSDGDGENTENKPELDTFELGDGKYTEVENSSNLADKTKLAGTFYLKEGGLEGSAGNEYYVKLSNNPDNVYKVKVDESGYLYPIATEIDLNLVNNKDGKPVQREILISNNDSCKAYLRNKLPAAIKNNCSISWHDGAKDYILKSYGKQLTIEPMTIAGDWNASENLGEAMAFLNLTNYIRTMGEQYGNIDPDIKFKEGKLIIKGFRDRGGRAHIERNLSEFGLGNVTESDLSKFKRYNNHEKWENNWNNMKDNRDYIKKSFPSIKMNESTGEVKNNSSQTVITNTDLGNSRITRFSTEKTSTVSSVVDSKNEDDEDVNQLIQEGELSFDKITNDENGLMINGVKISELGDDQTGFGYKVFKGKMVGDEIIQKIVIGDYKENEELNKGIILMNGSKYIGELEVSGGSGYLPNGQGKLKYPGGSEYEGSFLDGKRNEGVLHYKDNTSGKDLCSYEGSYKNDKIYTGFLYSNVCSCEVKINDGYLESGGSNKLPINNLKESNLMNFNNHLLKGLEGAKSLKFSADNKIIIEKDTKEEIYIDPDMKIWGWPSRSLYNWMNDYIQSHKESA